jgi:hypothetical protein
MASGYAPVQYGFQRRSQYGTQYSDHHQGESNDREYRNFRGTTTWWNNITKYNGRRGDPCDHIERRGGADCNTVSPVPLSCQSF